MRTVNEIVNDWLLTPLRALIITEWDNSDWEGDPDIIPEVELRDKPWGRDPSMIEKNGWSPLIEGVAENVSWTEMI